MKIATENFSYWVNNIDGLYTTGVGRTGAFVNPHPQIRGVSVGGGAAGLISGRLDVVEITFKGGDILHIDIDDDFSKTADLKIMIDGTDYASDAANINDEVEVVIDAISYSDASLFDDYEEEQDDMNLSKYPHEMYDCATGDSYTANNETEHQGYADLGYVHSMSECKLPDDDSGLKFDGKTILIVVGGLIAIAVVYSLVRTVGEE